MKINEAYEVRRIVQPSTTMCVCVHTDTHTYKSYQHWQHSTKNKP